VNANVIYGTVRLIAQENETFLHRAQDSFAFIIFPLFVDPSSGGMMKSQLQSQTLIDCAIDEGGFFYLTYYKWAGKDQIETFYSQFLSFLTGTDLLRPPIYRYEPMASSLC
jgi:hypothetical protein